MRYAKRMRDLLIETVVAVALVTVLVIYLFHLPKASSSLPWGWIKLIVNTIVVFGFLVAWFRHSWRNYVFWIAVALLLLCHLLLLGFLTQRIHSWPLAYYALLINPIELVIFTKILKRIPQSSRPGDNCFLMK
ncbi:MAG: hypothetical protein AUF79_00035 [Crenarchaeota archaeon 13_1_20CM_2_51_8]|nr:MAG: hypothetical protein AUF79_00035 [Crenarchaeota archaeon 13_1_20CM_2_51_8]